MSMEIMNKPKDKALLSVQFNQLAKPLMKFIKDNYDDFTTVVITSTQAKLSIDDLLYGTAIEPININNKDNKQGKIKL